MSVVQWWNLRGCPNLQLQDEVEPPPPAQLKLMKALAVLQVSSFIHSGQQQQDPSLHPVVHSLLTHSPTNVLSLSLCSPVLPQIVLVGPLAVVLGLAFYLLCFPCVLTRVRTWGVIQTCPTHQHPTNTHPNPPSSEPSITQTRFFFCFFFLPPSSSSLPCPSQWYLEQPVEGQAPTQHPQTQLVGCVSFWGNTLVALLLLPFLLGMLVVVAAFTLLNYMIEGLRRAVDACFLLLRRGGGRAPSPPVSSSPSSSSVGTDNHHPGVTPKSQPGGAVDEEGMEEGRGGLGEEERAAAFAAELAALEAAFAQPRTSAEVRERRLPPARGLVGQVMPRSSCPC